MIKIGQYNTLKIERIVDFGVYLGDGEGNDILLPAKYLQNPPVVGDEMDVFVYTDGEDRPIATTIRPYAVVGDFAYLRVRSETRFGAFLEWGIQKDLLVPFREQKVSMKRGGVYLVYVYLDDATKRVVASAKIEKFIGNKFPLYRNGDKVKALVYQRNDLGFKAIVDNLYHGMLYSNELYEKVEPGDTVEAFVKQVRDDGKIDLTLSGKTVDRIEALSVKILEMLDRCGGRIAITDSSSPETIKQAFQCSKKDFKKAIGHLYREKRIVINDDIIEICAE